MSFLCWLHPQQKKKRAANGDKNMLLRRRNCLQLRSLVLLFVLATSPLATVTIGAAAGDPSKQVLYNFCSASKCADGAYPDSPVIADAAGNLFGVAGGDLGRCGIASGCGIVFELSPSLSGGWTQTVVYAFCSRANCADGFVPRGGLIRDTAGNLYGTASGGGSNGGGVVFKLTPNTAHTGWTESVLYSFCPSGGTCIDGSGPVQGVISDAAGNLYGTAGGGPLGGSCPSVTGCGVIFELTNTSGRWTETVLHNVCSQSRCADGLGVISPLITDPMGNLHGITGNGGAPSYSGVVFELSPNPGHTVWTYRVLYDFCSSSACADGGVPTGLTRDAAGNLYGTALAGGSDDAGAVFKLAPPATSGGAWTETVLYNFCSAGGCADGEIPESGVVVDSAGALYGTTFKGGSEGGGAAFKLTRPTDPGGTWTESILCSFRSQINCSDGVGGASTLILDAAGNLYGTTPQGASVAIALTRAEAGAGSCSSSPQPGRR